MYLWWGFLCRFFHFPQAAGICWMPGALSLEKYCIEQTEQNKHLCPQAASIPEGNRHSSFLRDTGRERGCWRSRRGARSPPRKDCVQMQKKWEAAYADFWFCWWCYWYFQQKEHRRKGHVGWTREGSTGAESRGPLGPPARCHWRLWCLTPSPGLARFSSVSLI